VIDRIPARLMKFRPCIDIHEGVVKQIVGSTLTELSTDKPVENFISTKPTEYFAHLYRLDGLTGGHIIMLGPNCEAVTMQALQAYPKGLQVGGGITSDNAARYLDGGASHVVVTSYVFSNGTINFDNLNKLVSAVGGREKVVIDLSCRRKEAGGPFYVVTNKWTLYTDYEVNEDNLNALSVYCAEFLVHGVDVEGKRCGIEEELVALLGRCSPIPVTYAGGVRNLGDMDLVNRLGGGRVDCTVGSALDIFGGGLAYADVVEWHKRVNA